MVVRQLVNVWALLGVRMHESYAWVARLLAVRLGAGQCAEESTVGESSAAHWCARHFDQTVTGVRLFALH